jgi:hypothetical protein
MRWRIRKQIDDAYVRDDQRHAAHHGVIESGDKIVTAMRSALNLFSSVPDLFKPGILHHSGNRPAPPSDYTPLARRSAFSALAVSPRHAFISSAHFRIRSLALR